MSGKDADRVGRLAGVVSGAGIIGMAGGLGAWLVIRSQLAGERIVVPGSSPRFPGKPVRGPLTAFAEAAFIQEAALRATGGRTYGELPEGDPNAAMAKEASLLRASLFTSILAFGVAAAGMAVGFVLVIVGRALAAVPRRGHRRG